MVLTLPKGCAPLAERAREVLPTCPRHPNHSLWYRDGAWWSEHDGISFVSLGEFSQRQAAG
jgi:hypothetical protein